MPIPRPKKDEEQDVFLERCMGNATMNDDYRLAYRMWSPDPEYSGEAESPMKAVLEIAEELAILTKAVRATAVSRILNGVLKVPAEISFGSEEPGLDDDPEENRFLADLIDHITGAIENAGSAEAATPSSRRGRPSSSASSSG